MFTFFVGCNPGVGNVFSIHPDLDAKHSRRSCLTASGGSREGSRREAINASRTGSACGPWADRASYALLHAGRGS